MIVEVPVIGALALHVLFYVKEGSFSLFELPVKQLQFSPCPFHSIPASIHLDLPALHQRKLRFAEAEWFGKRGDLTLLLVYPDSHRFEPPHNLMPHPLGFFDGRKDQKIVVHEMRTVFGFSLTEHPVVD